jgi:hypothetical protein
MARNRRSIGTLLVLALASTAIAAGTARATPPPPAVPSSGVLFGTYISPRWGDQGASIRHAEGMLGRLFDVTTRYHGFTDTFYKPEVNWTNEGRLPMASWRATGLTPDPRRAAAIAKGTYDATIITVARAMKAVPGPLLVRFASEMTQAPGQIQYIGNPKKFVAAWRHVVDLFRKQGVTNVRWVWDPQAAAFCNGRAQTYYPGNRYVDWIAGTAIPPSESTRSFSDLFSCFYDWASHKAKPLMVQAGVVEVSGQPNWKANWMAGMRASLKAMPAIKALIYWNAQKAKTDYWADTSPGSWTNYSAMACDPYFNPNGRAGC